MSFTHAIAIGYLRADRPTFAAVYDDLLTRFSWWFAEEAFEITSIISSEAIGGSHYEVVATAQTIEEDDEDEMPEPTICAQPFEIMRGGKQIYP